MLINHTTPHQTTPSPLIPPHPPSPTNPPIKPTTLIPQPTTHLTIFQQKPPSQTAHLSPFLKKKTPFINAAEQNRTNTNTNTNTTERMNPSSPSPYLYRNPTKPIPNPLLLLPPPKSQRHNQSICTLRPTQLSNILVLYPSQSSDPLPNHLSLNQADANSVRVKIPPLGRRLFEHVRRRTPFLYTYPSSNITSHIGTVP